MKKLVPFKLPKRPSELKKPSKILKDIKKSKLPKKPSELKKIEKTIGKTYSGISKILKSYKKPKEIKRKLITRGSRKISKNLKEIEMKKEFEEKRKQKILEAEKKQKQTIQKEYSIKLNKFVKKAISEGYGKEQIKKLLIDNKWPKEFVNDYCNRFFEDTVKKALPKEEYEKMLDDFILESIKKDLSKKDIQKALISAGWPRHFIKLYVGKIFKND